MVGVGRSIQFVAEKSTDNRCNQIASFVASDVAMYSASMVDTVVHSCNFDLHEIDPPT